MNDPIILNSIVFTANYNKEIQNHQLSIDKRVNSIANKNLLMSGGLLCMATGCNIMLTGLIIVNPIIVLTGSVTTIASAILLSAFVIYNQLKMEKRASLPSANFIYVMPLTSKDSLKSLDFQASNSLNEKLTHLPTSLNSQQAKEETSNHSNEIASFNQLNSGIIKLGAKAFESEIAELEFKASENENDCVEDIQDPLSLKQLNSAISEFGKEAFSQLDRKISHLLNQITGSFKRKDINVFQVRTLLGNLLNHELIAQRIQKNEKLLKDTQALEREYICNDLDAAIRMYEIYQTGVFGSKDEMVQILAETIEKYDIAYEEGVEDYLKQKYQLICDYYQNMASPQENWVDRFYDEGLEVPSEDGVSSSYDEHAEISSEDWIDSFYSEDAEVSQEDWIDKFYNGNPEFPQEDWVDGLETNLNEEEAYISKELDCISDWFVMYKEKLIPYSEIVTQINDLIEKYDSQIGRFPESLANKFLNVINQFKSIQKDESSKENEIADKENILPENAPGLMIKEELMQYLKKPRANSFNLKNLEEKLSNNKENINQEFLLDVKLKPTHERVLDESLEKQAICLLSRLINEIRSNQKLIDKIDEKVDLREEEAPKGDLSAEQWRAYQLEEARETLELAREQLIEKLGASVDLSDQELIRQAEQFKSDIKAGKANLEFFFQEKGLEEEEENFWIVDDIPAQVQDFQF